MVSKWNSTASQVEMRCDFHRKMTWRWLTASASSSSGRSKSGTVLLAMRRRSKQTNS